MNRLLLMLLLLTLFSPFLLVSCTYQYTKEFISVFPPEKPEEYSDTIEGWIIDVPGVVAYKNLKNLKTVSNPDKFWLTIRTRHPLQKNIEFNGSLEIDSIGVIMYGIDSSLLTEVSRNTGNPKSDFVVMNDGKAMPLMRIDTVLKEKRIQSIDTIDFHYYSSEFFSYSYSSNRNEPTNIKPSKIDIKLPAFRNEVVQTDSLFVEYETVYRSPSRVAPFIDSRKRYQHIAFDFFRDKGIIIPDDIVRIKIVYNLSLTGVSGKKAEKELQYNMLRFESSEQLPFMLQ